MGKDQDSRKMISRELEEVTAKIVENFHPEKIILFGSYAWGKPNKASDIDLFIIVASSVLPGHKRATEVYRALRSVPRTFPLDVVVHTKNEVASKQHVVTSLTRKILTEGKILYG